MLGRRKISPPNIGRLPPNTGTTTRSRSPPIIISTFFAYRIIGRTLPYLLRLNPGVMKDPAMDYDLAAENIRASYREVTSKYRDDDEIEVTTDNHQHLFCVQNHRSDIALFVKTEPWCYERPGYGL